MEIFLALIATIAFFGILTFPLWMPEKWTLPFLKILFFITAGFAIWSLFLFFKDLFGFYLNKT